jgi:REP element-mobilizing transposase RayT
LVIASHGVFATYGFWPPNDPRGSWSDTVWATHLQRFGEAKKVSTRKSIAHQPFDRALRREIDRALKYPKVALDARQRCVVGSAIGEIAASLHLKVYALAVMPDHVHFVSARHREDIETIVGFLKRSASRALAKAGLHPMHAHRSEDGAFPTPWVQGGWKRFLNTPDGIADAIQYVRENPVHARLPVQEYSFETPFVWYRGAGSRGRDRQTRDIPSDSRRLGCPCV